MHVTLLALLSALLLLRPVGLAAPRALAPGTLAALAYTASPTPFFTPVPSPTPTPTPISTPTSSPTPTPAFFSTPTPTFYVDPPTEPPPPTATPGRVLPKTDSVGDMWLVIVAMTGLCAVMGIVLLYLNYGQKQAQKQARAKEHEQEHGDDRG